MGCPSPRCVAAGGSGDPAGNEGAQSKTLVGTPPPQQGQIEVGAQWGYLTCVYTFLNGRQQKKQIDGVSGH